MMEVRFPETNTIVVVGRERHRPHDPSREQAWIFGKYVDGTIEQARSPPHSAASASASEGVLHRRAIRGRSNDILPMLRVRRISGFVIGIVVEHSLDCRPACAACYERSGEQRGQSREQAHRLCFSRTGKARNSCEAG